MDTADINHYIGRRIRDLRNQNGLTQQELADRTELTKGFISQLERGQVSASVVTLFDLIECLGTTPADFFKSSGAEKIVYGEKDFFEKVEENGNSTTWIVPSAQGNRMEPVLVTLQPHTALTQDDPHDGEEFGYVLSGRIALYRQETRFDVKAGESFYYEADKAHRIENPGSRPARFLWVSSPPSF